MDKARRTSHILSYLLLVVGRVQVPLAPPVTRDPAGRLSYSPSLVGLPGPLILPGGAFKGAPCRGYP